MKRISVQTRDNSSTLYVPELDEYYHSTHGAIQESRHVFIEAGLLELANRNLPPPWKVLEVGLGTGLNALLTCLLAQRNETEIHYHGIEKHPLTAAEAELLNYPVLLGDPRAETVLKQIHQLPWGQQTELSRNFRLYKEHTDLREYRSEDQFHLIYFDAFAPEAQPELWTEIIFKKMYRALRPGGHLVTYCVKGRVRRAMHTAGFQVGKLPGPPGKREMCRAFKNEIPDD